MRLLIKQEQLKFKTGLKMAAGLLHDIVLFTFSYAMELVTRPPGKESRSRDFIGLMSFYSFYSSECQNHEWPCPS